MSSSGTPEAAQDAGDKASSTLYTQRTPNAVPTACQHCGGAFKAKRRTQRFCRPKCRFDHHNETKSKPDAELASLKRRVADLEEAMALVRGHLVL